jgi:hypothetical protein
MTIETTEAVPVETKPKCAWCRLEINGEPREARFRGRTFLTLCQDCADNAGQAIQSLVVLGGALMKKKTTTKEKP